MAHLKVHTESRDAFGACDLNWQEEQTCEYCHGGERWAIYPFLSVQESMRNIISPAAYASINIIMDHSESHEVCS